MPPVWVVRRWRGRAKREGRFNPLTNRVERVTLGVVAGDEEGRTLSRARGTPRYRFPWPYLPPESVDKFPGAFYGVVEGEHRAWSAWCLERVHEVGREAAGPDGVLPVVPNGC